MWRVGRSPIFYASVDEGHDRRLARPDARERACRRGAARQRRCRPVGRPPAPRGRPPGRPDSPRRPQALTPFSRESLDAIVRLAAARELAAARDVSRLFESAGAAGLDLLLLKGTALAYTHYPQPHLRPRNDIDLFVRQADLGRADAVLSALGFARATGGRRRVVDRTAALCEDVSAGAVHVDLHWRVVNPQAFADVLAFDDVWARSVSVAPLGPVRAHAGAAGHAAAGVRSPRGPSPGSREPAVAVGHSSRRVGAVTGRMGTVPRGGRARRACRASARAAWRWRTSVSGRRFRRTFGRRSARRTTSRPRRSWGKG